MVNHLLTKYVEWLTVICSSINHLSFAKLVEVALWGQWCSQRCLSGPSLILLNVVNPLLFVVMTVAMVLKLVNVCTNWSITSEHTSHNQWRVYAWCGNKYQRLPPQNIWTEPCLGVGAVLGHWTLEYDPSWAVYGSYTADTTYWELANQIKNLLIK